MRLLLLCLLSCAVVAPLAIGCSKKTPAPIVWSSEGDPKEQIELLKSRPQMGFDVRVIAANRLGAMGPRAQEALPHLEKLTKDKDQVMANAAKEAIAKINGQ